MYCGPYILIYLASLDEESPLGILLHVSYVCVCLISALDLVWFRLSCDHGWILSGSVNVR